MKLFQASLTSLLLSLGLLLILLTSHHFQQMKARGELMLCLKETKGELHLFMTHIEKTNWAIKHIDKAKYLIFIPGLQAAAANTERAKELIKKYQDFTLARYLLKLSLLQKRCRQSPQSFKTPYEISMKGFRRKFNGTTIWRNKWKTQIIGKFEVAQIQIKEKKASRMKPEFQYSYSIKEGNAWSLLPSLLDLSPSSLASMSL